MSNEFPETLTMAQATGARRRKSTEMMMKVPIVTATFWAIKILSTTVGETFADFLAVNGGWVPFLPQG